MPKVDTILNPYWAVADEYNMLDTEFQTYVIKGAKKKFDDQLKRGKADNLYEVTLHMLNLNSMIGDRRVFNRDMKPCANAESINKFVDNFFLADEKKISTPAKAIKKLAEKSMIECLGKFLEIASGTINGAEVAFHNKRIHLQPVVFMLFNISTCDVYEVWKVSLNIKTDIAGDIAKLGEFRAGADKTAVFNAFIAEYNKNADPSEKMQMDNTMVMSKPNAIEPIAAITAMKDVLLYNKLFIGDAELDLDILSEMRNSVSKESKFSYKLTVK